MTPTSNSSTHYQPATWRLLDTGWQDGATNMAIDEAIMQAVAVGESLPTLRFYGWQPPAISLGYAQPWDVVDWEAAATAGWDVVRRPTGGRAILHIDELTYSVCAPESESRVRGGVLESYQRLSDALAAGLVLAGLDPARAQPASQDKSALGPACFDGPSNYEITIDRRKLVGSAQARKQGMVLQHGTLPLYGDITRITQALHAGSPDQRRVNAARLELSAITLENAIGRRMPYEEIAAYLRQGFEQALNLHFEPGTLTRAEQARARDIRAEKFGNEAWTKRL